MIEIQVRNKPPRMNMAPLIDIVFLLLIFFLLTSHFMTESQLGVKLPSAHSRAPLIRHGIVVTVPREGPLSVAGKRLSGLTLKERLQQLLPNSDKTVVIRGDREVSLQRAVSVMATAKDAGAARIVVATVPERGSR